MTTPTDRPAAPSLTSERTFHAGPSGGHGGEAFEQPGTGRTVIGVAVRHGAVIDAIGLIWRDAPDHLDGGSGGTLERVLFAEGETLARIRGRHGAHLDHLELTSSHGQTWTFGGDGGRNTFTFDVPTGTELTGLFGRAGTYIDALGVILTPAVTAPRARTSRANATPKATSPAPKPKATKKATEAAEAKPEAPAAPKKRAPRTPKPPTDA